MWPVFFKIFQAHITHCAFTGDFLGRTKIKKDLSILYEMVNLKKKKKRNDESKTLITNIILKLYILR